MMHWRNIIKKITPDYLIYLYKGSSYYQNKLEKIWRKPTSIHKFKEKMVTEFKKKYSLNILVETGTAYGEMVFAMKDIFKEIISIELSYELHITAKRRLRGYENIKLLRGDSGQILPLLVKQLNEPCLFWLDAHFSGGETVKGDKYTPIVEELTTILEQNYNHVILIDDAEGFGVEMDYPAVDEIKNYF